MSDAEKNSKVAAPMTDSAAPIKADESSEHSQSDAANAVPQEIVVRHPLKCRWALWYLKGDRNKDWKDCLKQVSLFHTVEDLARHNHIQPASGLTCGSDFYLFKEGIKPMWEDPGNAKGGRWLVVVDKQKRNTKLDQYWLELMMAIVGEQFEDFGDNICGAVVNVRQKGDKVALWTADALADDMNLRIGQIVKAKLDIPDSEPIRYEVHNVLSARTGATPRIVIPFKELRTVIPAKESRSAIVAKMSRTVTPAKESRSAIAAKESRAVTPTKESSRGKPRKKTPKLNMSYLPFVDSEVAFVATHSRQLQNYFVGINLDRWSLPEVLAAVIILMTPKYKHLQIASANHPNCVVKIGDSTSFDFCTTEVEFSSYLEKFCDVSGRRLSCAGIAYRLFGFEALSNVFRNADIEMQGRSGNFLESIFNKVFNCLISEVDALANRQLSEEMNEQLLLILKKNKNGAISEEAKLEEFLLVFHLTFDFFQEYVLSLANDSSKESFRVTFDYFQHYALSLASQ